MCVKLLKKLLIKNSGGERGIRTPDTLVRYTHFPGVRLRPLGHFSSFYLQYLRAQNTKNKAKKNILFRYFSTYRLF